MSFTLRRTGLLFAATALLAVPAGASAALPTTQGVYYDPADGGSLVVNAESSDRTIFHVTRSGSTVTIMGSTGGGAKTDGCTDVDGDESVVACEVAGGLGTFVTNLTGPTGDDQVELDSDLVDLGGHAFVSTGEGDDHVDATGAQYAISLDLGKGDDSAVTGDKADEIHGGDGDDTIEAGLGDDTVYGDAGTDYFASGPAADGDDHYYGGTDPGQVNPYSGDIVGYSDRTTALTAVLPPDVATTPLGGNGQPGESDAYLGIEGIQGSNGNNTLTGNERPNYLSSTGAGSDVIRGGEGDDFINGRNGADTLDGGGGNDVVNARVSFNDGGVVTEDPDTAIDCGAGDDTVVRDFVDPAFSGCEHDAPGFRSLKHAVTGSLNVGQVLTLSQLETFGDPATTTFHWQSCANADYEDCKALADGPTYTLGAADQGRFVSAYGEVSNGGLFDDYANSDLVGPVAGPLPKLGPIPTPTPGAPVAAPAALAKTALNGDVRAAATLVLGTTGIQAFEPAAFKTGKVTVALKGGVATPVLAITCPGSCVVTAETKVKSGAKPKKGAKQAKPVKLAAQKVTAPAGGGAGTVVFKPTSKQAKAIKGTKKPKLVVTLTTKDAAGKTQTATKVYSLTAAKPVKGKSKGK